MNVAMVTALGFAILAAALLTALWASIGVGFRNALIAWRGMPTKISRLDPFVGFALVTSYLSWCYIAGFTSLIRVLPLAFLALFGMSVTIRTQQWTSKSLRSRFKTFSLVAACVLIASYALIPGVAPWGGFSFTTGIGPDSIGYVISGQAIASGIARDSLDEVLTQQFQGIPLDLGLSPLTSLVYDLPSFTDQVQAEFLAGAGRIGWAGVHGMLIQLLGFPQTWLLAQVMCASSLLVLGGLAWFAAQGRTFGWLRTMILIALVSTSSVTLYSWHQGGLGQIWVMPALFASMVAIAAKLPDRLAIAIFAGSIAVLTFSYSDALPLLLIVVSVLLLMKALKLSGFQIRYRTLILGTALGLITAIPLASELPTKVGLRSLDASQAGWWVPSALSLRSLVGLGGFLDSGSNATVASDTSNLFSAAFAGLFVAGGVLLVLIILVRLISGQPLDAWASVSVASSGVVLLIFVWTQVILDQSNYQLLKATSLLLPLAFGGLVFSSWSGPSLCIAQVASRHGDWVYRLPRVPRQVSLLVVSTLFLLTWILNSQQFIRDYRSVGYYSPQAFASEAYSPAMSKLFNRYAFVADESLGWEPVAMGALGNFQWLNRSGVKHLLEVKEELELAILTTNRDHDSANHESLLAAERVGSRSGVPDLVPLGVSAGTVVGLPGSAICEFALLLYMSKSGTNTYPCMIAAPAYEVKRLAAGQAQPVPVQYCYSPDRTMRVTIGSIADRRPKEPVLIARVGYQQKTTDVWLQEDGLVRVGRFEMPSSSAVLTSVPKGGALMTRLEISPQNLHVEVNGSPLGERMPYDRCPAISIGSLESGGLKWTFGTVNVF